MPNCLCIPGVHPTAYTAGIQLTVYTLGLYLWSASCLPGTLESILPVSQKSSLLPAFLEFFLLPVSLETKLHIHSLEFILLPVCVYPLSQSYGLYPKSLQYITD